MPSIKKNQGSALLTALFIMTIVAIVATAISSRLQQDIYRTRLLITHDQLYLASQTLSFWALSELNNKKPKFIPPNMQGMIAVFPKNMESMNKQIKVTGGLYDLQARFNLNNLSDKKAISHFFNLLNQVLPSLSQAEKNNIALALDDWLAPHDLSRGNDNLTAYYVAQKPPYYPSHQLMKSSSEFRLLKNVNATMYLALEPFITALPEATPININTAPMAVLMSLSSSLSKEQAGELIHARENGINDLNEISELLKILNIPNERITLESQYFFSIAHVTSDGFNLFVYTVFKRSKNKEGKLLVSVLQECIGGNEYYSS